MTTFALVEATKSIRAGDQARTNRMFRRRIYAQGFTIIAMCAGSVYYSQDREKRKKYDRKLAEQIALEKREAWIRELEFRDREDEEFRRQRDAARIQAAQAAAAARGSLQTPSPETRLPGVVEAVKDLVKTTAGSTDER